MTLIAEIIVTVVTAAITVVVPSNTGRHLLVKVRGASDAAYQHVSVGLQINGDTAADYSWAWEAVRGGPAFAEPASGGGDEVRARVGLVPGSAVGLDHAVGDTEIVIPNAWDSTFVRTFSFQSGETLSITSHVSLSGHGAHYANRTGGSSCHQEQVGYATSPGGMSNGLFDAVTSLWYDSNAGSPPNSQRTVCVGAETNTPEPVSSLTLLLDVGSWVPGTRVQVYGVE